MAKVGTPIDATVGEEWIHDYDLPWPDDGWAINFRGEMREMEPVGGWVMREPTGRIRVDIAAVDLNGFNEAVRYLAERLDD